MLPDRGRVPSGHGSIPSTTRAGRADAGTTGTGAARRAEGSAASGLADACLHRGVPDGWRASRGSPGDRVGGGRRPGRRSSVGRGAARGAGRRRHQDPEVPPRAEAGAGGRRGAQGVAGGPGGRAGGCRIALAGYGHGIHHGHRCAAGCDRPVRKMFQDVCERAGLGRDWAPRDLRHTFVSLLSDDGMAIERIARLVGHAGSHVTETVYRQELRPVLQEGAEVMDRLFGTVSSGLAEAAWTGCGHPVRMFKLTRLTRTSSNSSAVRATGRHSA